MCNPARLLDLTEAELTQLQHNCLLELLRRYPPTWPTTPAYNLVRRIFDTTRELHQALEQLPAPTAAAKTHPMDTAP